MTFTENAPVKLLVGVLAVPHAVPHKGKGDNRATARGLTDLPTGTRLTFVRGGDKIGSAVVRHKTLGLFAVPVGFLGDGEGGK